MEAHSSAFDAERLLEHVDWVRALARRLVADGDAADDIVQETWASALAHRPAADRPLRPWLASVLRNFARERRRSESHRKVREEAAAVREALPSSAELAGTVELHKLLVELVLALDEPYRETVILRTFRGLSSAEIARDRGVPAATVRWRLKVGLDALREELDRRHRGDRSAWCAALVSLASSSEDGALSGTQAAVGASSFLQGVSLMSVLVKFGIGAAVVTGAIVATIAFTDPDQLFSANPDVVEVTQVDVTYAPIALVDVPVPTPASIDSTERSAVAPDTKPDAPSATPEPAPARGFARARALDENERPIAGVEFSLRNADLAARTGLDGIATFAEPEAGWPTRYGTFDLVAPGFASATQRRDLEPGATVLLGDFVLGPGGDVLGRIVDSEGIGLAGAFVGALTDALSVQRAKRSGSERYYPGSMDEAAVANTDADGYFRLEGVPVGNVWIFAGERDHKSALSTPVDVRAGEEARGVLLTLEPLPAEGRVDGIVLTHAREPVPYAHIAFEARSDRGTKGSSFAADADGRFRISLDQSGPPDHLRASDPNDATCVVSVRDVPDGTLDLELVLPEARFFELEVRAPDGSAVASYAVEILAADRNGLAELPEADRPDGVARLRVPGESFLLRVLARGFERAELGPFAPENVPARVPCALVALPGVRGVVVAAGEPFAGADVRLLDIVDEASEHDGFPVRLWPFEIDRTTTDANGAFALTVRESGTYALLVEGEGFALAEVGPLDVDPKVGVADLVVELRRGGALDVVVHAKPGRDPSGPIVACSRGDSRARTGRVGPDGRVHFEHLAPGRWQVELHDPDGGETGTISRGKSAPAELPWNCEVREGETSEFEFWIEGAEARGTCRLVGTLAIDGAPPGDWRAILGRVDEPNWMNAGGALVDPSGRFELEADAPGLVRLAVLFESEREADQRVIVDRVDLRAGDNTWVCAYRTGTLEGFAERREDDMAFCVSEGPGERMVLVPIVPDADGRFTCSNVPAGRAHIVLLGPEQRDGFDPKAGRTLTEVDVPIGKTAHVDLR